MLADTYISPDAEISIFSQARPKITKGASGTFNYGGKNYVYLAYNPTLTYTITVSNPYGTELINQPVIIDDLTDLSNKFNLTCGTGLSLAQRVSEISDGGVLSGTTLTWNLPNI
jgi:hypothetical protein